MTVPYSVGSVVVAPALDEPLVAPAVGDERVDGDDLDAVLGGEHVEVGTPRHAPVGAHDLADDPGGEAAGELAEVDDRLGLAGALEHTAHRGSKRKGVARLGEVARLGVFIAEQADGGGAVEGADAGGDAVADCLDGDRERGAETRRVVVDHGANAELVEPPALAGHADEPASVGGHEVDGLGRDAVGGDREIALVLAVLVVDDDHELAGADVCDGLVDAGKTHRAIPVPRRR